MVRRVVAGLCLMVWVSHAHAAPNATRVRDALHGAARSDFDRATDDYARGRYLEARQAFVRAHELW